MCRFTACVTVAGRKILSLGLLFALGFLGCAEETPMPEELVGTYVTSDARYAGRHFRLTPAQLTLGLGDGQEGKRSIKAFYKKEEAGKVLYTVVYETSYGDDSLVFYRDGGPTGELVLKNQPEVRWTKGETKQ